MERIEKKCGKWNTKKERKGKTKRRKAMEVKNGKRTVEKKDPGSEGKSGKKEDQ